MTKEEKAFVEMMTEVSNRIWRSTRIQGEAWIYIGPIDLRVLENAGIIEKLDKNTVVIHWDKVELHEKENDSIHPGDGRKGCA